MASDTMRRAEHARRVSAWLEKAGEDAPALLARFEAAWAALRRRVEDAVGEVVLAAVAELVRSAGVERHPFLAPIVLEGRDVSCRALLASAETLDPRELQESLGFMLAEFIARIADLTDDLLTPGLYAELAGAAPDQERTSMPKEDRLITTGIPNLDAMLAGGFLRGASMAIAGPPGSGKTILAQQIAFHNATVEEPVLFFSTLSEPGAKTLFYLNRFDFSDPRKLDESIHFVDLGVLLRTKGLPNSLTMIVEHVKKLKPSLVVIDSFRVFEDMAASGEELRKFSYELVLTLMAHRCTALFLGEYAGREYENSPLFSIIDGLVLMTQRELSGENQRFIQVVKMRGVAHDRDEHSFEITRSGLEIFAPRLTIKRSAKAEPRAGRTPRCKVGIPKLDDLLGGGIPRGSSLLVSGVAGTGKTVLGLEFVYRGALAGEKGVVFSFEETEERLRAAARGLGWDLDAEIKKGLVEVVFNPQPDILVEHDLLMMQERVLKLGAARVVIDSLSVFLHKIKDPQIAREKVFQLASIVQNTEAVGLFATDIPYGTDQISRFGVEETVVDGVLILSSTEEGLERRRYIEAYKLRNTAHLKGRHSMSIDVGGIQIFPRYLPQVSAQEPPPAKVPPRLSTGIVELDRLLGSGVLARSLTLVSGSSGSGKSVVSLQFLLEGASLKEPGLYVTLEEGPAELLANARALGLPLQRAVDAGLVEIIYLPPTHIRSTQLLALLTDKIKKQGTRRLVLDSATHIVASGMSSDEARELLYDLAVRFKGLGVTTFATLEADSMYSTESGTERGFSPLADNVIMLRYVPVDGAHVPSLWVVKTRGSAHDGGVHSFKIGEGGLHLGAPPAMKGGGGGFTEAQA